MKLIILFADKNEDAVSQEVLSTLFMLANVTNQGGPSPNMHKKNLENLNVLNLVNNKMIEEEQLKMRKSAELKNNIMGKYLKPRRKIMNRFNNN